MPFLWKTAPTPLWFTLVCLIKWTISVPNKPKVDSSGNGAGSHKVRLWQPRSALQKEMNRAPDSTPTSSYAFPWQSGQGDNPFSPCRALNTPACPQVHTRANISVSHLQSAIQTKAARELASPSHIRDKKKQVHNQKVTWALLVSLGRSKLPVFPLNILVLVLTGSLVSR